MLLARLYSPLKRLDLKVCKTTLKTRELAVSGNPGAFDRSMQHHLGTELFQDGVYDPRKVVEIFSH